MKMYRNTENGRIVLESEIQREFESLKLENPAEYPYDFPAYLSNCTDGNGFLEEITPARWSAIASYMNDEIRETVHAELAPCTNDQFLLRYVELDPAFTSLLWDLFRIDI